MLGCVTEKYKTLDTEAITAQSLKDMFRGTSPLSAYNRKITDLTVNEIRLRENGGLSLMLINGQELGKEKPS